MCVYSSIYSNVSNETEADGFGDVVINLIGSRDYFF